MKNTKLLKNNLKHELFCQYYAGGNSICFNNATKSYMYAYGYIEKLNKANEELINTPYSRDADRRKLRKRIKNIDNQCRVGAHKLVTNANIKKKINDILDSFISTDVVDRELQKVILQNKDLNSKIRAISEYNKVKQRAIGKLEGEFVFKWKE